MSSSVMGAPANCWASATNCGAAIPGKSARHRQCLPSSRYRPASVQAPKRWSRSPRARLLSAERVDAEVRHRGKQVERSGAKVAWPIVRKDIRASEQDAVLAAHGSPHQRTIAGVEFLDAAIGFDDFGAGHRDAPLLRHRESRAARGDQASAAITAGSPHRSGR